jgi:hypothetical protein
MSSGKSNGQMRRDVGAFVPVALLLLYGLVFFAPVVFSGRPLWGGDFVSQFYPWKRFIYDHVRSCGTLPFWNPYLFSGTPFIANIQASMFYPLGFLYYLLPPDLAYGYSTMLHVALGSIFMYIFMRGLRISRTGGLISALIFSFNGYFMGHLYAGHLSFVQSYVWIPLIFHLLYRFTDNFELKYAIATGLVLGIQILGGFPQITFYTALAAFFFVLYQGITFLKIRAFGKAARLVFGFSIVPVVAFCLAAVQLLPTLEFSELSTRAGGISYDFATYDSLHPKDLLAFLIPDIFGNPIDHTYWVSLEPWHFWESCGYVGMLPLILAFVSTKASSLRVIRIFFVLLLVSSLFLALGRYNPIYPLVHKLPGFDRFRIPAQIIFLYVFGIAVVSGLGLHMIEKGSWQFNKGIVLSVALCGFLLLVCLFGVHYFPYQFFFELFKNLSTGPVTHADLDMLYERIRISIDNCAVLFIVGLLLIVLHKKRRLSLRLIRGISPAIILIDLYLFGGQFIRSHEFKNPSEKQSVVEQLDGNPSGGRILPNSRHFLPNDGLLYKFPSALGYDPLILRRYVYFLQSSQNQPRDNHVVNLAGLDNPNSILMRLLNVRKTVVGDEVLDFKDAGDYMNIVNNAIVKPSEEVLSFMKSDEFDRKTMVVFEPGEEEQNMTIESVNPVSASCAVLGYDNETIRIRTSSDQKGFLVLSEIFYPGWKATVDRKKVEILRGNYLFCVIPLEKGDHDVHLYFVSWPFRIGVVISLLTLTFSIWYILRNILCANFTPTKEDVTR